MFAARDNETRVRVTHDNGNETHTDPMLLCASCYTDVPATSNESLTISCSGPVLVAQLCKSYEADGVQRSDPFMTLMTPVVQYAYAYDFSTLASVDGGEFDNYLNIVAPTTGLSLMFFLIL